LERRLTGDHPPDFVFRQIPTSKSTCSTVIQNMRSDFSACKTGARLCSSVVAVASPAFPVLALSGFTLDTPTPVL